MVYPDDFADLALPMIRVKSCKGWEEGDICSPIDLPLLDESEVNRIVLLGECNSGKSGLCFWLGSELVTSNPSRDVNLIDLPRAAVLWKNMKKTPTSLIELVEVYFGKNAVSFEEKSELLLDDHHQLSTQDQRLLMSMLTEDELAKKKFPFRVWLFARKNFEDRICTGGVREAVFEIAGYSINDQKRILFDQLGEEIGQAMNEREKDYRKDFVRVLHAELMKTFPDFDKTLGRCPIILEALAVSVFPRYEEFVKVYCNYMENSELATEEIVKGLPRVPKSLMVSHIVSAIIMTQAHKKRGLDKEGIKHAKNFALLLIAEYALETFPSYQEGTLEMDSRKRDMICDSGFVVCDKQGKLKFHDKILADALIGHYFGEPSVIHHNMKTFEFFTKVLLLKKEAAAIRYFYDMALSSDRRKKSFLSAKETGKFLINMYKLDDQDKWLDIRDKGNIWHMNIMERNYELAALLLECFDPIHQKEELVRFFKMRALLSVTCLMEDSFIGNKPFHVLASNISFAAMFFSETNTKKMLMMLLRLCTVEEIKAEFSEDKEWTPIHFAAMNANGDFIRTVYSMKSTIPTMTNLRNPFGQTAVHVVAYSFAWKYKLELAENVGAKRCHWGEVLEGTNILKYMHECLELLINKGGENINACEGVTGETVLHMAIKAGNLRTVDFMLELGANPAICDVNKRNCVYYAAKYGYMRYIIRLFSRCGASTLFAKDVDGTCALSVWKQKGQYIYMEENGPLSTSDMRFFATCYYVMELMTNEEGKQG